jgi:hypothetical protein
MSSRVMQYIINSIVLEGRGAEGRNVRELI